MKYNNVVQGRFIARPNRFIARVLVDGLEVVSHVKNTGRCKELLKEGAVVYLEKNNNEKRKTAYSLIAVEKGEILVNIDSQAPNKMFSEALTKGLIRLPQMETLTGITREKTYGSSRFDFFIENDEKKAFVEVKGVTLEEDGVAKFPDAPTERGIKHVKELIHAVNSGYLAYIVFVIQMDGIKYFVPNDETHPAFGNALRIAAKSGVHVAAYESSVSMDSIDLKGNKCEVIL